MPFIDEAVLTCSKYDDFLKVTLPITLHHVKRVVVVTSDQDFDQPTRELCRFFNVECITTDMMYGNKARFAKGKAINRGLDLLGQKGWTVHLDADIALPDHTSHALQMLEDHGSLDDRCIYGIDRVDCSSAPDFRKYLYEWGPQHRYSCLVEVPRHFPLSGRYIHPTDGYVPIGYFQLWNGKNMGEHTIRYPEKEPNAIRNDVQFALKWPASRRILLPEIIAIHLNSIGAPLGANWDGRQTPRFDMRDEKAPDGSHVLSYFDPRHPRFQKDKGGPAVSGANFQQD